ncbi:serine hydrolase domain-containing protein [Paenibacillus sp. D2_2]|uniref:serine hydrolase domain-containing protein n=1 Tax=Paenibacillus sp. D2_2 TaxID=3073092 RepID=UPI002815E856|nr:serine hydrolase domain-containing protein [Paenibacillus sp. D2_2]WMT43573.1 serine hydrolase domain-containing protein [Paenibacillus sp. D2_2]
MEAGKLQGASYLVAKDGKIVAHQSLGKLTYHNNSADLQLDSIRQVYSITKAFTSVAIARLVEEGKLYYKQQVCTWIKEFDTDYHRDITLWHLLTHTSGLMPDPGCLQEPYPFPWYGWWVHEKRDKSDQWSASEWIKLILGGRMAARPGEQWNYCTAGYAILGEVIARVSGMSYEQYIREYITEPLGMEHTFMDVPKQLHSKVCYVNPWEENGLKESAEHTEVRADVGNTAVDEMPPAAGNGLFSTLHDLWKFGQCLLDGGTFNGHTLLGRRTVENMVSNQLSGVPSKCWGITIRTIKCPWAGA